MFDSRTLIQMGRALVLVYGSDGDSSQDKCTCEIDDSKAFAKNIGNNNNNLPHPNLLIRNRYTV